MKSQNQKLSPSDKVGFLTLANSVNQVIAIITSITLARFLSKELYGTYKQVTLIYEIIAPIFIAALPSSFLYFFPHFDTNKKRKFLFQTIFLMSILGALLSLFILFTSGFFAQKFSNPQLKELLVIFSLVPLFSLASGFFNLFLVAEERVKFLAGYLVGTNLIYSAGIIFLILKTHNLKVAILWMVVYNLLLSFFDFWYTQKNIIRLRWEKIDKELVRKQLAFSIPLAFSSWIGTIGYQIDRLAVSYFFNPAVLAVYSVGAFEIPFLKTLTNSVGTILIPEFSSLFKRKDYLGILKLWQESIRKLSLIMFPAFIYLELTAFYIIKLFFGNKYLDSVILFQIYQLFLLIRVANYGSVFQGVGLPKISLYGTLIFVVFNALLTIMLIKVLGITGPAIATIIAAFINVTYFIFKYIEIFPGASIKNIWPWKELVYNFFFAALSGVTILLLSKISFLTSSPFIFLLVSGISYFIVYLLLMLLFRRIKEEDKRLLKKWLRLELLIKKG